MSRSKQHYTGQDAFFKSPGDYKLAVKVLRKFAPQRFSKGNGYDLAKWKTVKSIPAKQRAQIRKYYRYYRPLLTYALRFRTVADPKKLGNLYHALYQIKPLPGTTRVPYPQNFGGDTQPVRIIKDEHNRDAALVEVYPGVQSRRITFKEMGIDNITALDTRTLLQVFTDIFDQYRPDSVGLAAGLFRARFDDKLINVNDPRDLLSHVEALRNEYNAGKGNHAAKNWMIGVDLFWYDTRGKMTQAVNEEQKRWKARNKLSTQLKAKRKALTAAEAKYENGMDLLPYILKLAELTPNSKKGKQYISNYKKIVLGKHAARIDTLKLELKAIMAKILKIDEF